MDSSWEFVLSAFLLIVAVRNYKAIVYYSKFNYFYGMMTTVMTLLIPFFMIRPKNVLNFFDRFRLPTHVECTWSDFHSQGEENLQKDRTCVFVANHQSSLDVQGMFDVWPAIRKMTVIAKRELLLFSGPFGVSSYLCGLAFINRKSGGRAGQEMNDAVIDLKKKNIKLWVFPEGTRRNTGEIHQFKKGAFHAAIQAQVPIVPIVYSSYKPFLDTNKKIFEKGEIIITALPEISTEGLTAEDVDSLVQRTRDAMIAVYDSSSQEVQCKILKAKSE